MSTGDIQDCLDSQWHVCWVMDKELKRNFGGSYLFKELLIFILSDFSLVSVPDGLETVDYLTIKLNGVDQKLGKFLDYFLYFCFRGELSTFWFKSQNYFSSSFKTHMLYICNFVFTWTVWNPSDRWIAFFLWINLDMIWDNETWVKSNTELTNYIILETRIFFSRFLDKFSRTRSSYCS